MSEQPPLTDDRTVTDVSYFMIRVERSVGKHRLILGGTIERLGSGERQRFEDGYDLLRLVATWRTEANRPATLTEHQDDQA